TPGVHVARLPARHACVRRGRITRLSAAARPGAAMGRAPPHQRRWPHAHRLRRTFGRPRRVRRLARGEALLHPRRDMRFTAPPDPMTDLPAATRAAMLARSFAIQGSWNFRSLIGTGFCFVLLPAL